MPYHKIHFYENTELSYIAGKDRVCSLYRTGKLFAPH